MNTAQCCTPALLLDNGDAWELERCGCGDSTDPDSPVSCGGNNTHELLQGFPYFRWVLGWGLQCVGMREAGQQAGWLADDHAHCACLQRCVAAPCLLTATHRCLYAFPNSLPTIRAPTCPQAVAAGPRCACGPRPVLPHMPVWHCAPDGPV